MSKKWRCFFIAIIIIALLCIPIYAAGGHWFISLLWAIDVGLFAHSLGQDSAARKAGHVVITRNEDDEIVAVTRQDDEGRILRVLAVEPKFRELADAVLRHEHAASEAAVGGTERAP